MRLNPKILQDRVLEVYQLKALKLQPPVFNAGAQHRGNGINYILPVVDDLPDSLLCRDIPGSGLHKEGNLGVQLFQIAAKPLGSFYGVLDYYISHYVAYE